jgi:hypothetical protein
MRDGPGNQLPPEQEAAIRQIDRQETRLAGSNPVSEIVTTIAQKHDVAVDAAEAALAALRRGRGSMAQFSHPDFGGMAQWSAGGMSMVGDMFNAATKAKLDGVLQDLADALRRGDLMMDDLVSGDADETTRLGDWPPEFGSAATTGSQNDMRYAFFPNARRLVIEDRRKRTIYDTGEHMITGVAQQQSAARTLTFRSQLGAVTIADFSLVE